MRLITVRQNIREVAARWASQYPALLTMKDPSRRAIHEQLLALDVETATAEQVNNIIGNDTWTRVDTCQECGVDGHSAVAELGDADHLWDDPAVTVCKACLFKAAQLFDGGGK